MGMVDAGAGGAPAGAGTPEGSPAGGSAPGASARDASTPEASTPGTPASGGADARPAVDAPRDAPRSTDTASGGSPDAGATDAPPPPSPADAAADSAASMDTAAAPAPPPPAAPAPAPGQARADFFRSDVIHRIEVTIDPALWQAYLNRHRSFPVPPGDKWFAGDFVIDGTPLRNVGFHTFGWGSRLENRNKPNLSIDIDQYVAGQSLRGIERMRLKNNAQDVSGLRQALLYQAMRESNLLAPRTTYADLIVNGQPHGLYFVEEAFTDGFVRERTGNGDGPSFEPAGCQGFVSPALGGCARIVDHFDRVFNDSVAQGEQLVALCQVMNGPPEQFLAAVGPLIPLSEWIDQLAIDTALAGNRDGFSASAGNFRLYHDTALNRLRLVILGNDDTFVPESLPAPNARAPEPHQSCRERNPAYRDLFLEKLTATGEGLALYQAAVRRLRTGVLSPEAITRRVDALWATISTRVVSDPLLDPGADPEESKDRLLEYVARRWPALEAAGF